ncbi:MAG: transglutaminase domain-containing protein [Deltaproteobacteria bacterium]|nr:transglutaminase domain-containing protein [Deltaproteobacteria bacterium]
MLVTVVVVVWLGLLAALVQKQATPPEAPPLPAAADLPPERLATDEWFGIYQGDRKIGWAHRSITKVSDGLAVRDDSSFRLAMLGTEQRVQTSLVAETDPTYTLKGFRFQLVSPAATFSADGEIEGDRVSIEHGSGEARSKLEIPLKEPIHLPTTLRAKLALWDAEPGARHGATVFSPLTMKNEPMTIVVEGRETIPGPNGPVETVRIAEDHQGLAARAWIAKDGSTIREEATLGFRLERQAPEVAVADVDGSAPVDLALESRIPLDGRIESPRESSRLRLAVRGAAAARIPDDPPRQRVRDGILEIEREPLPEPDSLASTEAPEELTKPSPFIESGDAEIVTVAREVAGDETDHTRIARKLVDWVGSELTQEPSVTIPSARAVLATKRGDCNEHAVLLAALARAAGIPARVVAGATYADDGFYYHAWNELWLGGRWVSADAIFRQLPADATHVKFLTGGPESHLELADVVGRLEFATVESPS